MPKRIYVGNLPRSATSSQVSDLFRPYGRVGNVTMNRDGSAIVEMPSDSEGDAALGGLRNARMGTNSLNVNEARPRAD